MSEDEFKRLMQDLYDAIDALEEYGITVDTDKPITEHTFKEDNDE